MRSTFRARLTLRRLVLLCAVVAAVAAVFGAGSSGAATNGRVLILSTSVVGGAGSVEATAATGLGRSVDVVTPSQWALLTQSDFAAYDAIILGDPNCGYNGGTSASTWVGAAEANAAVWGPAVTGNVIVIGSDPVLHGKTSVTQNAVKYALDSAAAGQTGAYISLSCYYHGAPAHTPVKVLSGFGTFTTTGVGSLNDAHIVAVHPALTGLTDAALSNWSNSVHEALDTIDSAFLPLAIGRTNAAGATTFPDGSVGIPYIVARGAGLRLISNIDLAPATGNQPVGTPHALVATVKENNVAVPGITVTFTVLSGPHAGSLGSAVTNASGNATVSYTGTLAGTDSIQAKYTDSLNRLQISNTVTMTWTKPLDADLSVTKSAPASAPWGTPVTSTITVGNAGPAAATGVTVTDTITGGTFVSGAGCTASAGVVTCTVGSIPAGGSATVSITAATTAAGTLADTATVAGDQVDLALGNNSASASTAILAHPTALALDAVAGPITAGAPVALSATLTDAGSPVAGQTVTLGLGGTQSCTGTTNAAGVAACSVTVDQPVGPAAVTAAYAGTADYGPSSDSGSTSVVHETAIVYTGDASADYHDSAALSAKLTDAYTGAVLAGKSVLLVMGAQSCTDATNASGVASCSITVNQVPGGYVAIASFAGTANYLGSSTASTFAVTKEQTATVYTGATATILNGSSLVLSGTLKEDGTTAIAGRSLTLSIGSGASLQSCTDTTNAAGAASCTVVLAQPAGAQVLSASFAGDAFYLGSADTASVVVYSARSVKQDALDTLNSIGSTSKSKDDDNRIASAARQVARSLNAAWWIADGIHLTLQGCQVFDYEKSAASQLLEQLKSKKLTAAQKAAIQAALNGLVQADQILATIAVSEATAANGNAKKLALANKALAKAASLLASGKPDEAINQYRIAWEKAQESLGRKVCGDDGHEDEDGGEHHDRHDD